MTKVDDLLRKGLVQAPRLLEARRSSLLSASRALQTKIALEDAKRDRTDLQSKLDSLDRDRKVELLTDLEKANSVMRNAAVELQGLQRQLALQGDVSDGVQIMIFRNGPTPRMASFRMRMRSFFQGTRWTLRSCGKTARRPRRSRRINSTAGRAWAFEDREAGGEQSRQWCTATSEQTDRNIHEKWPVRRIGQFCQRATLKRVEPASE